MGLQTLGLAVPLVIAISTTLGAGSGLLVRDRRGLEEARNLDAVVFDKTGTLTLGEHRVVDLAVLEGTSADEALRLANDSPFGLQGSVFTRSLRSAFRFSEDFDVGALWVNEASRFRLDLYPFGGSKNSGFGREGVRDAIEELSQVKFTGVRFDV